MEAELKALREEVKALREMVAQLTEAVKSAGSETHIHYHPTPQAPQRLLPQSPYDPWQPYYKPEPWMPAPPIWATNRAVQG